jgi:hypothetical protein
MMFVDEYLPAKFAYGTTSWAVAVGSTVAGLVYVTLRRWVARRRRLRFSADEDLPWEDLLGLLRSRERELAASGKTLDDDLPPDELLALLLSRLPAEAGRRYELPPDEEEFLKSGGAEKRAGRRRWGNPTEVHVTSVSLGGRLHGIVINRSTGGLGVFIDRKLEAGALAEVRAVEAPGYVPSVQVEVKFCRKIRRHYLVGCQFLQEIPWNVRVWFG